MFELKIYIEEKKYPIAHDKHEIVNDGIETFVKIGNYDVINAELKILRNLYESTSLTDKCEYFRFLPINRTNIV